MEYPANINTEELIMQKLLSNYLTLQNSSNGLAAESMHLDEDMLSAFVEGSLGQRESQPVVTHLVDCSFCRNVTSELVKLDMAFAEEELQNVVDLESPSKISQVLSSVLARIFGSNDGAVFAHQEKEEKEDDAVDKIEE
jgi:lipase chaperone LimK